MKVVLLYIRVIRKSDPKYVVPKDYDQSSKRFLETYQQFKPTIPHELCVVNCGSETHDGLFDGIASRYETDMGGGFDCGTYQHIGGKQPCDLVVGLNTHTYFWRNGWLEPIVRCAESCGKGVYGVSGSYEQNPHLRTPCIAFSPEVMRQYPHQCLTRLDAGAFEFGPENFSLWAHNAGFPTYLVTEKVTYDIEGWRFPRHGFRDGNQRNCLVWDRHTELYASSDKATKRHLESMANGN
jgi:hypothetical protein